MKAVLHEILQLPFNLATQGTLKLPLNNGT